MRYFRARHFRARYFTALGGGPLQAVAQLAPLFIASIGRMMGR